MRLQAHTNVYLRLESQSPSLEASLHVIFSCVRIGLLVSVRHALLNLLPAGTAAKPTNTIRIKLTVHENYFATQDKSAVFRITTQTRDDTFITLFVSRNRICKPHFPIPPM